MLLRLIENENTRKEYGKMARKNVDRYSPDKVMQQWINLFNELVKEVK